MISTLQRMYRHFNFRLCDIIDVAALVIPAPSTTRTCAHWPLPRASGRDPRPIRIVSDYVASYRGTGLDLPRFVVRAGRFGGEDVFYDRGFLHVPIMPQSAGLYRSQLAHLLGRGELHNGVRLSLLPWLATAAAAKQRFTGSDKGIW